jgi:hypothetical protein
MGSAANGGSGVVVIRIACAPGDVAVTPGTNTVTPSGSDAIARFTVTGTLTV